MRQSEFLTLFIPATLVLILGVYDDLRGTNAIFKFVGLGLIATLFYAMGGRIDAISVPLFGSVELPPLVSFFFTIIWLVGITNAFNLIDGLDGLASGAALFSSLVFLGVSVSQDRPLMIVVSARLVRRGCRFSTLQLQSCIDLSRRLGRAVHRFPARGDVRVGNTESNDRGRDLCSDSRFRFSGG